MKGKKSTVFVQNFYSMIVFTFSFSLFCLLMTDVWSKYLMKSTTVVVSTLNKNINDAPVPGITFCPAPAFKNAGFQYTTKGYNENTFAFQDLFLNETSDSFNVTSIDTPVRGRCYTLTQTNTVKKSQRVKIQMRATVDTLVSQSIFA